MIGRRCHRPKVDGCGIGCLTVSERRAIETRIARINAVLRDLEDKVQRLRTGDKQWHLAHGRDLEAARIGVICGAAACLEMGQAQVP
jgi:hypothetical protein